MVERNSKNEQQCWTSIYLGITWYIIGINQVLEIKSTMNQSRLKITQSFLEYTVQHD